MVARDFLAKQNLYVPLAAQQLESEIKNPEQLDIQLENLQNF